jgi:outer membrane protein
MMGWRTNQVQAFWMTAVSTMASGQVPHRRSVRTGHAVLLRGRLRLFALVLALACIGAPLARAETLPEVLVRAYQGNPQLNAERARQRGTDEAVPQALSAYRPQVSAGLSAGIAGVRNLFPGVPGAQSATLFPWSVGVTINQTIFNGFKTANTVRQSEAQVRSGRQALRHVEQSVLLDAVTAYMDVLSFQTLVEAQRVNLTFLRQLSETTRKRYQAGDVTPTDVAQGDARTARGIADLNNAQVNLAVAKATFARIVGAAPGRLAPSDPIDRLLPHSREEAVALGRREQPAVVGAQYDVDVALSAVKIAESALYPNVSVQGNISRSVETDQTLGTNQTDSASVIASATVPIYDGGFTPSQIRQAKESLSQVRLTLTRTQADADSAVAAAWVTNEGARVSMTAAQSEVNAATIALSGVQKEAQAGQRTTLDVLNSQQDLMTARARLIQAQRDRVVASYTLLGAIGRLDAKHLALKTPDYSPQVHYQQVRDAWHGLRTPSGQ